MAGRILQFIFWLLSGLFLLSSSSAHSENRMNLGFSCTGVTSCDNNAEALPPTKPGKKKKFTVEIKKTNGSDDTSNGLSELLPSGIMRFAVSSESATGRLTSAATYNRNNREGLSLDSFLIFRSFFSDSYFNVLSSSSSCKDTPASPQNYNWVIFRGRSPQSISNKIYANDTSYKFAGVVNVSSDTSSTLDGTGAIDLNTLSLDSSSYNYSPVSGTSCSVNSQKLNADSSNQPLGVGASLYWGDNSFVAISRGANPNVALGIPQTNLTSQYLAELAGNSFSGMMYYQSAVNSATFKTLLISPNNTGTQFNIQELSDFSNPNSATSWGSLTCSDLNSPAQGFCKGTLTKNGQTGNALCAFGTMSSQGVMACTAQLPSNKAMPIYFFSTYPARASLTFSSPVLRGLASSESCGDVTVSNISGRIANNFSMGSLPSGMNLGPNAYDGQSGRCSSSIPAFSSCTVPVCATIQNAAVNTQLSISYEENPTSTDVTQSSITYERAPEPVITLNANFSSGTAPLTVTFTANATVGTVTNWFWDFGDGTFDTSGSPTISHTYANGGSFTASVFGVDSFFQNSNSASVGISASYPITISSISTSTFGEVGISGNNFDSVTQIQMGLTSGTLLDVQLLYKDNTFIAISAPWASGNYTVSLNGGTTSGTFDYQAPVGGCMDGMAINYNAAASFDDGSCIYGCSSFGFTDNDMDGVCSYQDCDDNNSSVASDCSSNFVLHLPMNGGNGSSSFSDEALSHSFSVNGNAQITTSVGRFGGASGHFTRANQEYLITTQQNNEFNFGTGDFTIEAWINSASLVDSSIVAGSGNGDWMFAIGQTGGPQLGFGQNNISWDANSSSLSWNLGQWNHVAATRQSGTLRLFFNGEKVFEAQNSVNYNIAGNGGCNSSGTSLIVGGRQDCGASNYIGQTFDGHIDDLKIIKGYAKYTNSFPPESCSDRSEGADEGCGCGMGTSCLPVTCPADGWCIAENAYYIGGIAQSGLDSSGTGTNMTDGNKYYVSGIPFNGIWGNICYANGGMTMDLDWFGNGFCTGDYTYYIVYSPTTLNSVGTGYWTGTFYVNATQTTLDSNGNGIWSTMSGTYCYANGIQGDFLSFQNSGWCSQLSTYYINGTATTLDQWGNGLWNHGCYTMGSQGTDPYNYNNETGWCSATSLYYISGIAQVGLDSSGVGTNQTDNNRFYYMGSRANASYNGTYYLDGLATTLDFSGNGVSNHDGTLKCYYSGILSGDSLNSGNGTGYCIYTGLYYIAGSQTTLDSTGSGTWNGQLYINGVLAPVITIQTQPSNQTASGGNATFSIIANVTQSASLSYQWQKQESGSGDFNNISGATNNSLSLSSLTNTDDNGDVYRVVVSASGGAQDVTSDSATLTVPTTPDPPADGGGDTLFDKVEILLSGNSEVTNLATDGIPTVSYIGSPNYSTDNKMFGSAAFNLSPVKSTYCSWGYCYEQIQTANYLLVNDNSANKWVIPSKLTAEFFFKPSTEDNNRKSFYSHGMSGGMGDNGINFWHQNSRLYVSIYNYAWGGDYWAGTSWNCEWNGYAEAEVGMLSPANWYHLAAVRDGSTLSIYKDGVRVATSQINLYQYGAANCSASGDLTIVDDGYSKIRRTIGAKTYADNYGYEGVNDNISGYIDEFRYTKNVARYTDATYDVPLAAYPRSKGFIPPAISFVPSSFTLVAGSAITAINPRSSGGEITSCSVSPELPAGLSLNNTTCVITGTPTYGGPSGSYTITATNSYGTGTANLTLVVNGADSSGVYYWAGSIADGLVVDRTNDKTVLLLHMDGSNGSTTFTDSSRNPQSVTANGSVAISSTQSKFGGGSGFFNGTSNTDLRIPVTSNLNFGTGDFAMEAWIYLPNLTYPTDHQLVACSSDSGGLCFGFHSNGTQMGIVRRNVAWDLEGPVSLTANTWYHIAATRENGTARIFLNGALIASGANTQNYTFGTTLHIGSHNGSHYYYGYIDDLRMVKGSAIYTSNFTPPTSAIGTGASYTCYSNGINTAGVNSSGTGYCSANSTYYISGTAYDGLDMTGSGVSGGLLYSLGQLVNGYTANNCYFNGLNTGEVSGGNGWCSGDSTYYLSGSPTTLSSTGNGIHDGLTYSNGTLANGFFANHDNDKTVLLLHMNGTNNSTTFTDSSANNLSAVKAMTSLGGSKGCSPQGDESGANFLGETFGTSQHGGNCPNWCQTNYPTTKCSQMYATWAYSGGHCSCWSSTTSYNWPGWGDREVWIASDTKISTAQSKFGGSSAYFDGSGDYITYQSSTAFAFGVDDFSVEFWMKASSFGGTRAMVTTAEPSDQYGFWVGLSNNSLYWLLGNGSWGFSRTPVAVDNSWHHIALTRQSGMARLFLDGTLVDSVSYPTTLTNPNNAIRVGGRPIGSQYFHGYLDEIRITKGAALYTANFTPPASALGTGAVYGCYTNGSSAGGVDSSGTGYCLFNNTYYISGTAYEGLDSNGNGSSGGLKYSAGSLYNGFDGSSCYLNGAATGGVVSGNGWCSGDNTYYLSSMPTSLSASGSGTHNGQTYSNGSPANGFVTNHDNDKTVLLLHMDGSNNSTTFTDSSGTPKTISTQGDAKVSTSQSKFGGSSLALDGSGDYLQITGTDDLAFGTGDFTVELFVRLNSLGSPYTGFVNTQASLTSANTNKWYFGHQQGYGLIFGQHTSGNIAYTSWTPALNTWYHVAASRHNGTMYLAIDGVNKSVSNANIHSGVSFDMDQFTVGVIASPFYTNGYIDEVRITKGQALYTSSFTLSSNQLGTVGSVYGCYSNGSDLGSIDSTGTGYCSVNSTYYVSGVPGTGVYNGNYYVNGAYYSPVATISYSSIRSWPTVAGTADFHVSASIDQGATLSYQWQRQPKGTGSFVNIAGANSDMLTLTGLSTNRNDGDVYRVVLTGTMGASSVTSDGVALSVPLSESAAGDPLFNKVALLLHLDGDTTDTSSSPKNATLEYNSSSYATYSSTDSLFGSAVCFNGQAMSIDMCEPWGCYMDTYPEVKVPFKPFQVTPQWTLEFSFKPDSTWTSGPTKYLFYAGDNWGMDNSIQLYYYNGKLYFYVYVYDWMNGGGWYVNMNRTLPGSSISAAWHHLAVVRDGGSFTIYLDGAPLGSPGTYTSDDWYGSGMFNENYTLDFRGSNSYPDYMTFGASYGGYWGGSWGGWAGCMDEIRVTKDVRYNDLFTPDTTPFPDSGI